MPPVWTNDDLYSGSPSITYDASTVTYDSALYSYEGKLVTAWTNDSQS